MDSSPSSASRRPGRPGPGGGGRGRRAVAALVTTTVAIAIAGCASLPDGVHPVSGRGGAIRNLFDVSFVLGGLLFVLIVGLIGWVLVRYRSSLREAASQVSGNRRLEVTWTLATLAVLSTLFILSVHTMRTVDATSAPNALEIQVIGHRWWWEFRYPASGVVTADEFHVPTGTPIRFVVTSDDVIHSFWVPRFGWKQDAIPGKTNTMALTVDQTGTFAGACTEFCGAEHAWMRLRVIAQRPADFAAWLAAQQAVPPAPQPGGLAYHGAELFTSLACASCHTIRGTHASGTVGPDLTHVGGRSILAGGVLDNNAANMRRWLADPQRVKPAVLMPSLGLSPDQVDALAAYLEGLK